MHASENKSLRICDGFGRIFFSSYLQNVTSTTVLWVKSSSTGISIHPTINTISPAPNKRITV